MNVKAEAMKVCTTPVKMLSGDLNVNFKCSLIVFIVFF